MGALPVCDGNILQSLAGPCPMLRRGRCLHRPGSPAMPQGLRGGRERPPYIAAGNGRRRGSGSQSPSLATGRCSHRPGSPAMPQGPAAGVNARPTLRAGTSGDVEAVVRRQTRPRADASIGPYAGGRRRPCRPMPGTAPAEGHFPQAPARRAGHAPSGKADRIVTRSKISQRLTSHNSKAPHRPMGAVFWASQAHSASVRRGARVSYTSLW